MEHYAKYIYLLRQGKDSIVCIVLFGSNQMPLQKAIHSKIEEEEQKARRPKFDVVIDSEIVQLNLRFVHCPIQTSLLVLGKKWTLLILRDIGFRGVDRFNRLLETVSGITPRVLSMRLKELEQEGYIKCVERQKNPMIVRWTLTEKGRDALPILLKLLSFGSKWYPEIVFEDDKVRTRLNQIFTPKEVKILSKYA
jgi:DNA-binding HxlR family transcriptional regulator